MNNESLSTGSRISILTIAFLGWFFGGMQIGMTNLIRNANKFLITESGWSESLNPEQLNNLIEKWWAFQQCGFLFGAAAGGYIFGKLGDKIGRTRALGISIIWFSVLTILAKFVGDPFQLLCIRFLACLGIGGCWPNGVALVSEAWSKIKRPIMASLIGMAGNIGIFTFAKISAHNPVDADTFREVFLLGAFSAPLGVIILLFVKESPTWISAKNSEIKDTSNRKNSPSVFKKPYLGVTFIGIALATVPLLGGWGCFAWILPWASEVGSTELAPNILQTRSIASIIGSGLAAVIAIRVGRRSCYFVSCLFALIISQYIFWFSSPTDTNFLIFVAMWGFFNGIFFGWLPFFLPELFETEVRATGAGVSFNYGRILTATTIFLTPWLKSVFDGNLQQVGQLTSLIFIVGMIAVLLAPDTSKRDMNL